MVNFVLNSDMRATGRKLEITAVRISITVGTKIIKVPKQKGFLKQHFFDCFTARHLNLCAERGKKISLLIYLQSSSF